MHHIQRLQPVRVYTYTRNRFCQVCSEDGKKKNGGQNSDPGSLRLNMPNRSSPAIQVKFAHPSIFLHSKRSGLCAYRPVNRLTSNEKVYQCRSMFPESITCSSTTKQGLGKMQ